MSRGKEAVKKPSETDIQLCMASMSMQQLKDPKNGIFSKMPKSMLLRGRRIPRTALRKEDLCRLYLALGGTIQARTQRKLKHYTASKKRSAEQRKYEKLLEQRTLDHSGPKSITHEDQKKRRTSIGGSKAPHTSLERLSGHK